MNTENHAGLEHLTEPDGAPQAASSRKKKPFILLADDSPQIRSSLSRFFHQFGYQVIAVAHGGQVLNRALREDFDLLLLDLNMPEMDGWRTLEHLRSLKPELPVILITAEPDQGQWAAAEGARAVLEKPLDLPVLLETIRKLLAGEPIASAPAPPANKTSQTNPANREDLFQLESVFHGASWPSGPPSDAVPSSGTTRRQWSHSDRP